MHQSSTAGLVRAALAAAIIAASALITVPVGPIPVTLQVLAVAVCVLVLPPRESFAALMAYVGLGALGLPVFSGGSGGVGVLLGPTGGFIFGFLLGAPLGSLTRTLVSAHTGIRTLPGDIAGVLVLLALSYAAGLAWFTVVTGTTVAEAFAVAVAPFVIPDTVKLVIAFGIARPIRRAVTRDVKPRG